MSVDRGHAGNTSLCSMPIDERPTASRYAFRSLRRRRAQFQQHNKSDEQQSPPKLRQLGRGKHVTDTLLLVDVNPMRWLIGFFLCCGVLALSTGGVQAQVAEPTEVCSSGLVPSVAGGCVCPAGLRLYRNGIGVSSCVASTAETCIGSAQLLGNLCFCPMGSQTVRSGNVVSCVVSSVQICLGDARLVAGECQCPKSQRSYHLANGAVTCVSPPAATCPSDAQLVGGKCICPAGTVTYQAYSGAVACTKKQE